MDNHIRSLCSLSTGQRVRLTFEDTREIELQVNQHEFEPDHRLRLELTREDSTEDSRYRIEAFVKDGAWAPVTVYRYSREGGRWIRLNYVSGVTPLEMFRTMKSEDMKAQEGTNQSEKRNAPVSKNREVKLTDLDSILSEFQFPCSRKTVVTEGRDVTLLLADGTENLGDLISHSSCDVFDSMDDLINEAMNLLPRPAVGEPYQSEGEG